MGKTNKIKEPNKSVQKRRKKWLLPVICLVFIGLAAAVVYSLMQGPSAVTTETITPQKETPDFKRLIGSWVRPDGGYMIVISKIHPDGNADAAYYNPRSINVSRATVSETGGEIELFIKLQGQGYPGSTYTLKYNSEHDMMVGVYFQAAMQQSFDVIFQRKN